MRLTEVGFGCEGPERTGALVVGARAASSIQPLALLFKSWIWAKPALRPITRKGRPAGQPYNTCADEDALASRYRYMDDHIIFGLSYRFGAPPSAAYPPAPPRSSALQTRR